jgi:hypothetical protein
VVAAVAAVVLVAGVNWLVFSQAERLDASARGWVRYDLTSTRQYSLSPLTRSVLDELDEPVRVVTLLRPSDPQAQRARDLVDEFGQASGLLEVVHLDPDAADDPRLGDLWEQVQQRYAPQNQPVVEALAEAQPAVQRLIETLTRLQAPLQEVLADPSLGGGELRSAIENTLRQLRPARDAVARAGGEVRGDRSDGGPPTPEGVGFEEPGGGVPLVGYGRRQAELLGALEGVDRSVLGPAATTLQRAGPVLRRRLDDASMERALEAQELVQTARMAVREAYFPLTEARPALGYERVVDVLEREQAVVLLGARRAVAVPLSGMFRGGGGVEPPTPEAVSFGGEAFVGDDRLTSALIALGLDPPPLVVFLENPGAVAISGEQRRGLFNHVASRLEALGMQVAVWDPAWASGNGEQGPAEPPSGAAGQAVVWVVLPFTTPRADAPETMNMLPRRRAAAFVRERLRRGERALVMLNRDPRANPEFVGGVAEGPTPRGGGLSEAPLVGLLREWGIEARVWAAVWQQVDTGDGNVHTTRQFEVARWPEGSPGVSGLAGLPTIFRDAYPMGMVDGPDASEVERWPVVALRAPRMWEVVLPFGREVTRQPYDESASAEQFVTGVAAQRGEARLVAIGSPIWATDPVTTYGRSPTLGEGPGVAEMPGGVSSYPGNSELFVGLVAWLAGLEELSAASPRSQALPRIEPMLEGQRNLVRGLLVVGMPMAALGIGLGVWLVRRVG